MPGSTLPAPRSVQTPFEVQGFPRQKSMSTHLSGEDLPNVPCSKQGRTNLVAPFFTPSVENPGRQFQVALSPKKVSGLLELEPTSPCGTPQLTALHSIMPVIVPSAEQVPTKLLSPFASASTE